MLWGGVKGEEEEGEERWVIAFLCLVSLQGGLGGRGRVWSSPAVLGQRLEV